MTEATKEKKPKKPKKLNQVEAFFNFVQLAEVLALFHRR